MPPSLFPVLLATHVALAVGLCSVVEQVETTRDTPSTGAGTLRLWSGWLLLT